VELSHGGHDDAKNQGRPIGIEEIVQRAPHLIIIQQAASFWGKSQERRLKAGGPGTDSVEGFPREEEIAKQQADGLDRRDSSARMGRG